jgi:hypothetical protein
MKTKLSVVVVAGRRKDALELCVDNIRLATAQPVEIVVVLCNALKEVKECAYRLAETLKTIPETMCTVSVYNPHGEPDVYECYNYGAKKAKGTTVCLTNDDMVMAPHWDAYATEMLEDDMLMTGVLVEPGVVKVSDLNITYDLGRIPAEFQAEKFQKLAAERRKEEVAADKQGWYMPVLFSKDAFLKEGGYPTVPPFPAANDVVFFKAWVNKGKRVVQCLDLYAYHFQRLSQRPKRRLYYGVTFTDGYVNLLLADTTDIEMGTWLEGEIKDAFEYVLVDGDVLEAFGHEGGIQEELSRLYGALAPGGVLDIEFDDVLERMKDFTRATDEGRYLGEHPLIDQFFGGNDVEKISAFTTTFLRAAVEIAGFEDVTHHPGHMHRHKLTARRPA